MNRITVIPTVVIVCSFLCFPVQAEHHERTEIFAALPDWTGIWETEAAYQLVTRNVPSRPALAGEPPYKSEWKVVIQNSGINEVPLDIPSDSKVCGAPGFPEVMEQPVPDMVFEMLVTPEQTLLVSSNGGIRHIYTDGREHPAERDLWPTATGHSIGYWEEGTLVVDTIARTAGPVGPWPNSSALGEKAHFVERITRLSTDSLENVMTIEDSERFTGPWTITILYLRVTDLDRLLPTDCSGVDRNPFVDGEFIIAPL